MASPRHSTSIENLPDEVLSEIFIRLLAKQLAQMRRVSKSWNALISHSSFVESHLHHSIHHKDDILLFSRMGLYVDRRLFKVGPTRSLNLEMTNFIELPVDPQSKYEYGRVIGSVNGLICVCYASPTRDHVVYIWNPSLSLVLTLPACSSPYTDSMTIDLRFGFDPKTNDYKVVRLTSLIHPPNMLLEVEVYSMRKGSWESTIQRFLSHITRIRFDDYVCADGHDGRLHWIGSSGLKWKPQTIVAFDLGSETFREIPLPHSVLHHNENRMNVLGFLAGKLCMMSSVKDGQCEVWVMDEYGVADSWVKHLALSQFSGEIYPYGFTSDSKFLFQVGLYRVGMCDPVAAHTTTFRVVGGLHIYTIAEYVDSLVWVAPAVHELSKVWHQLLKSNTPICSNSF